MKNVADIYPVTPMQESMLLRLLSKPDIDPLFNQFCYEIIGELSTAALENAWQQLLDRHPALRTAFIVSTDKQPLQIVRQKLKLPFERMDWRQLSHDQQQTELSAFLVRDQEVGFDISKPPLIRVMLVQLAATKFILVWSSHHLLLDRWCLGTIYADLFELYRANQNHLQPKLPPPHPFRDYVAWIKQQDQHAAAAYWREVLQGFSTPTSLVTGLNKSSLEATAAKSNEKILALGEAYSASVIQAARGFGVTISTFVQAAWALVVNHYMKSGDLVFGTTVSGRPPDLIGVESIIGSFINNLPVRVTLQPSTRLSDWLIDLQSKAYKRVSFEFMSLAEIQRWSEISSVDTLFDTLLISLSSQPMQPPDGLEVRGIGGSLNTAYPLTISVEEAGDQISVGGVLQAGYGTIVPLDEILDRLTVFLKRLSRANDGALLGDIEGFRVPTPSAACPQNNGQAWTPSVSLTPLNPEHTSAEIQGRESIDLSVIEELIIGKWQQLLELETIGLDDNFFDLGGTSLLAARLVNELELATRKVIPTLSLFQTPTVRGMSRNLHQGAWPTKSGLIFPLSTRGDKPPLFCVASPEVQTIGYSILSRHLASDQPIYVVQLPPDTKRIRRLSVRELPDVAADYITAVKKIQPLGPYQLLGMCTGAQLSLEMARQLTETGSRVAFLGILDTFSLFTLSKGYYLKRLIDRADYYSGRLQSLIQMPSNERNAFIHGMLKRRWKYSVENAERSLQDDQISEKATTAWQPTDPPISQQNDWFVDFGWPHQLGEIEKYPGAVTLFRLRRQHYWRIRDPSLGWSRLVETVEVERLKGAKHSEILREPRVRELAARLEKHLQGEHETTTTEELDVSNL